MRASSSLQAPFKHPSRWSPLQASLKPPSSFLPAERFKPLSSPLEAPWKPPSSPLEAPLKSPLSPLQAPLKPSSRWSLLEAPWKPPWSLPKWSPIRCFRVTSWATDFSTSDFDLRGNSGGTYYIKMKNVWINSEVGFIAFSFSSMSSVLPSPRARMSTVQRGRLRLFQMCEVLSIPFKPLFLSKLKSFQTSVPFKPLFSF